MLVMVYWILGLGWRISFMQRGWCFFCWRFINWILWFTTHEWPCFSLMTSNEWIPCILSFQCPLLKCVKMIFDPLMSYGCSSWDDWTSSLSCCIYGFIRIVILHCSHVIPLRCAGEAMDRKLAGIQATWTLAKLKDHVGDYSTLPSCTPVQLIWHLILLLQIATHWAPICSY